MLPQAADFKAESDDLHALLVTLSDADWARPDEGRDQRHEERGDRGDRGDRGGRDRGGEARAYQQAPRQDPQQGRQWQPPPEQAQQPQDGGRRNGRMSVEERRALRRQIDQASHDIYPPGR